MYRWGPDDGSWQIKIHSFVKLCNMYCISKCNFATLVDGYFNDTYQN